MSATQRLDRLLHLLSRVASHGPQRIADLAMQLGVNEATLKKDIEDFVRRDHAEPAGFMEAVTVALDGDMVCVERASFFGRPMRLTRDEAMALDLSLTMLLSEYPSSDHRKFEEARGKLALIRLDAREPESAAVAIRVGQVDFESRRYRAVLEECVSDRRLVTLHYQKVSEASPSARAVGPLGLTCVRGIWYLYATNGTTAEVRQFRLDRVRGVEPQEESFNPPPEFDLDAMVRDGRAFLSQSQERVRVRFTGPAARWVAEDEGGALEADGSLTREYPLADPDWAVRLVLRWAPHAQLLAPQALRERLVAKLGAMAGS